VEVANLLPTVFCPDSCLVTFYTRIQAGTGQLCMSSGDLTCPVVCEFSVCLYNVD